MSENYGIVFPGQGSQSVGMMVDLGASYPIVGETFEEASDALGMDLWRMVSEGPEAELGETEHTQPAMLAAGIAVWRALRPQVSALPCAMAGHSLGEYTALVAAGAIDFVDGVKLVAKRGRIMQSAVPVGTGAMAALLGLDDDQVRAVCTEASAKSGVVEPINYNSPGQVVIAGEAAAVDYAIPLAKEAGAKRAVKLSVSVPSHCSLMIPAAERLAPELAALDIKATEIAVVHNADVSVAGSPDEIRACLTEQLSKPVLWVDVVRKMSDLGAGVLLEAGPGKVLAGLTKRIDRNMRAVAITDAAGLDKALETING